MKLNFLFILFALFLSISTGCRRFEEEKIVAQAEPFVPSNLYPVERLPEYFNRVVVLLVTTMMRIRLFLNTPTKFFIEIGSERIFETIRLSTLEMKEHFGVTRVDSSKPLPENFLRKLEIDRS